MQNFSAQDITYANYKEKLDMVLKNRKQNEIIIKNRKSISRSNSREKSLNSKTKQPPSLQKQPTANQNMIANTQQQGSKKNLAKNARNLQITTSYEKKQGINQQSNQKQVGQGNNTCTNSKASQNFIQSGAQTVQNKGHTKKMNNPQSCKNQSSSLHQNNTVSNNNINANQPQHHQQSNSLTPGIGGEQYHNFSSFFSSQSTKNNINNNLLNNSVQGAQQPQKNSDKITLFLQHLQSSDSPMKQILQIQDKLQSYHQNNNNVLQQSIGNNSNQQQLNSSMNNQTLNLNNSYCINTNNNNPQQSLQQLQQALHQRQRVNSNDCVFNINQSSITAAGMQSEHFDPYRASYSHQESLQQFQSHDQNTSIQHQKQPVAQVNLKLNLQTKQIKNNTQSPMNHPYPQKKNVFSMHSSASSTDPQKCLLNQFDDEFTPSSSIPPQNKFIDLSGANIQISDIVLDKKMNINELNEVTSQQHSQFLKDKTLQLKESFHNQMNHSENFDELSNNDDDCNVLISSMPVNCNVGHCNQDDEYLRTPKQNIYGEINKSQQLPYQHTPITYNQPKQSLLNIKQDERLRSKSYADQEYMSEMIIPNQQNQNKMFQKRRALTIADDSYTVLQNEDELESKQLGDSMKVNHTYHGDGGAYNQKINRKLIPKIKNFDQMIEEKNQQMDYEIPPHVYNETFQGEEYTSSQATSEIRSENHDSLNQTQTLENNISPDAINVHHTLKSNPMQGYRNMMKAMEISGKDNDAEIKALKITIRKLQYRDAVLRQKIAKMTSQQTEYQETITKLDTENNELINQVNAYAEQHELYEQQITQLQFEMQQFQVQVSQMQPGGQNMQVENELRLQIAQYEEVLENLRQELVEQEQTSSELREQLQEYEGIQEDLKQQLSQRGEEIQQQQYGFLEKLAEFQEENIRINSLLKTSQEQTLKNEEKQQLTKQINDLNSENEKLYEQITSLLKENEQYKQQKEVVSNVNDLSLKSLKLLDDNSKLMDENRNLQSNVLLLTKDNKQLKDCVLSLQSSPQNQQAEDFKYKQIFEESSNTIRELKQVNHELMQNISILEAKNKELTTHCSLLEQKINSQNENIKHLSNKQSRQDSPQEKYLQEVQCLQKEIVAEKEKCESLEKKVIQLSQKNSLNQSISSKQEFQSEEMIKIRVENDELRKELEDQCKEKECLEEVLKNYLLQRELEKLKLSGEQKILKDQEQDDEIAEAFQSDSKINAFLNSQQKTNMDLNSQILNYFSNSNQNKHSQLNNLANNINSGENYHMYKRNSNCTITNGNNTNYQISITECSQLSLLEEEGRIRINDEEIEHHDEITQNFNRNAISNNQMSEQILQDQQNISNINHLVSTNTNINNNNFNNNNTIHSNNLLKKSSASSSHFLREIDSNIQILINNNSNNTLLNNIQHLLNTSSSSNLLSKENPTTNNNITTINSINNNNITNNNLTPNHPHQQQTTTNPISNNLLQNLQLTPVPSNNQHQLNLSHQNLSTKLVTYHHSQKTKENDNPQSTSQSTLITSAQSQNSLQQIQKQKGYSDKISYQQQCASQVKSTHQNLQNKENAFSKTIQQNQFTPHSVVLNTNK